MLEIIYIYNIIKYVYHRYTYHEFLDRVGPTQNADTTTKSKYIQLPIQYEYMIILLYL